MFNVGSFVFPGLTQTLPPDLKRQVIQKREAQSDAARSETVKAEQEEARMF